MAMGRRRVTVPKVFEASVGGWAGPFFRVKLEGKKLDYQSCLRAYGDIEENLGIEPSQEEWTAFWDAMDRIGSWSWARNYDDPQIMDGTQWSVRIRLGRKRLICYGSNSYPPSGDYDETSEFREFCAAIGSLLGGKKFG